MADKNRVRDETRSSYRVRRGGSSIDELRRGLEIRRFVQLQQAIEVTELELAKAMHLAPRTLARRKKEGRLRPDESDRLERIARLFRLAVDLFEDPAKAASWFISPKRALGGESPLSYSDTSPGAREVEDLIGRLDHGVFS